MPPRRRSRDSDAAPSDSSNPESDEDETIPPLFNTTYAIHRVSPLYLGSQALSEARLEQLARRLREILVGDVIRGIQIGLESAETPVGQVGALKVVTIRWFQATAVLGEHLSQRRPASRDLSSDAPTSYWDELPERQKQGLWIEIRHENASYVAVLLPGYAPKESQASETSGWAMQPGGSQTGAADDGQFLHLPLLLLRMPRQLQSALGDWLAATFDCRVSKMTLGTRTIVNVWEQWLQIAGLPTKGPNISVTLGFNAPLDEKEAQMVADSDGDLSDEQGLEKAGLRTMVVTVSTQDLRRFVRAGKTPPSDAHNTPKPWTSDPRERRRLAGGNADDGWAWRTATRAGEEQPFTEALARYLDKHLALDMFHPGVRVVQISCGGFVLAQSRVKVVKSGEMSADFSRAAWMFVVQLGERIRGDGLPGVF